MTVTSIERHRIEAVEGLLDGLVHFGRGLKARSGDWGLAARDLTRGEIVSPGVLDGRARLGPARETLYGPLAERLVHWDLDDLARATEMIEDLSGRLQESITKDPDA